MADFSTCTRQSCKTVTPGLVSKCPVCGSRVITSRRIRAMGWLAIACGVFLIGMMGWITMAMYPTLVNAGTTVDGGRWNGTAEQGRMVLNLFYTVIGFGFLAVASGIWQVISGRRHVAVMIVTLIAAAILLYQVWTTTQSLKQSQEQEEARRYVQPPEMMPVNMGSPTPDKPPQ